MERESILYKIRRRGQLLAYYILPSVLVSRIYSLIVLKKSTNLKEPKTFNEKIQWLKIYAYPKMPLVIKCANKYGVRNYLHDKGLDDIAVPLLGVWDNPQKIEWNNLPEEFVLKCNHGCAYNILVPDKNKINKKEIAKKLNQWLKENFGVFNVELHYSKIKPRLIICEEFLGECITDYKFFCFNGKPMYIYVSNDLIHDRQAKIGFFYLDGKKMPLKREDYTDMKNITLPSFFDAMKKNAEILCEDFAFVRVDFFLANKKYYFAEMTFTPSAGMMPFNPDKYDLEWGNLLDINKEQSLYSNSKFQK